jgi:hypothetical protein
VALTSDRLKVNMERLFELMLPRLAYYVQWEMQVVTATPTTVSCAPIDPDAVALFGPAVNVTLWPGVSGAIAQPAPGTVVRVAFINGDPARPAIVGLDPTGTPLTVAAPSVGPYVIAGGASPIVPTPWATGLATALAAMASALATATTVANVAAAGTALESALAALPSPATTKVTAT